MLVLRAAIVLPSAGRQSAFIPTDTVEHGLDQNCPRPDLGGTSTLRLVFAAEGQTTGAQPWLSPSGFDLFRVFARSNWSLPKNIFVREYGVAYSR